MEDVCIFNYMKKRVNIFGMVWENRQNERLFFGHVNMKSLLDCYSFYTPYDRWQYTSFALLFTIILYRSSGTSVTSHKIRVE